MPKTMTDAELDMVIAEVNEHLDEIGFHHIFDADGEVWLFTNEPAGTWVGRTCVICNEAVDSGYFHVQAPRAVHQDCGHFQHAPIDPDRLKEWAAERNLYPFTRYKPEDVEKMQARAEANQRKRAEREAAFNKRGETTCDRCGGWGEIQAYKHVNGGVCFKCNGSGSVPKGGK